VLYYIAPKVWAWRPSRARTLAAVTDRVAVILPFEEALLREAGVRAEYVGHPLLDRPVDAEDGTAFRARWRLDSGRPLLAVLPGSRRQELERHLDPFVEAAKNVCAERPDVLPVLCRAPGLPAGVLGRAGLPVVDDARALLRHSQAALVKSGTATLEAALEGTPTVVAYRTSAPTWWVARALMRTEHVALPNVIAGGEIVPEYLQRAAEPAVLGRALLQLLDSGSPERRSQLEGFERVRAALGAVGDGNVSATEAGGAGSGRERVAERVADMALDLMRTEA
jgi:lipid-A-disaccharide synthase